MSRIIDFDENYGVAVSAGERHAALSIAPAAEIQRHEIGSGVLGIEEATHLVFRAPQQIDEFIELLAEAKRYLEEESA